MSVSNRKRMQFENLMEQVWLLMSDSHQKGQRWESDFSAMAKQHGLAVEKSDGRGDIKVNGMVVQCKHIDAVRSADAIDIANMRPVEANDGHRGYMVGEYDVLALRHHEHVYVIPAAWLDLGDGTLSSRVRLSEINQFRDAWQVFVNGYEPPARDKQLSLVLDKEQKHGR